MVAAGTGAGGVGAALFDVLRWFAGAGFGGVAGFAGAGFAVVADCVRGAGAGFARDNSSDFCCVTMMSPGVRPSRTSASASA